MKYTGSCHCGAVAYEFEATLTEAMECNCSHCSRKGYLLAFIPRAQFQLRAGEDKLGTYKFNKHVIDHKFCLNCGCAPFAFGVNPKGEKTAAINVRCVENFDLAGLKRVPVDGRSF